MIQVPTYFYKNNSGDLNRSKKKKERKKEKHLKSRIPILSSSVILGWLQFWLLCNHKKYFHRFSARVLGCDARCGCLFDAPPPNKNIELQVRTVSKRAKKERREKKRKSPKAANERIKEGTKSKTPEQNPSSVALLSP